MGCCHSSPLRVQPVDQMSLPRISAPGSATKVSGFLLPVVYGTDMMRAGVDASLALMRQGKLKMVVGKTYPLGQAAEALRFLASRASTGKLVLQA